MESRNSSKRKKENQDDDAYYRDKKSKRPRSKSRSPDRNYDKDSRRRRKRSYSKSPERSVKKEKENERPQDQEPRKDIPERKPKDTDMLNTRTGGAYIPPARLRMMQAQITDKSSVAYQRLAWEALKKSIHGHINKINVGNIGIIIKELLKENIVRGRGLLCRSVIQAQAASPTFTNVYAALVAAVNSRFPNIGELLLKRLVIQFKRGFKRNDKPTCISSASFIAHLVNQRVAHEILALELLTLLVETPTDDSVEVAIAFLKECGQKLTEVSSKGVNAIFEMLRNILHEGQLDKRVQYMIEVMFQVWKDGFKDHPALIEELELVPEEEQFTHLLMLDDATDPQDILNVFKFDEKYEENEQKYKSLSKEILGSDAESGEEDGSGESGSEESEEEDGDEQKPVTIIDNTETNLVALRRTIYLTINSSLDFEECAHKLMKMQLKPGQEVELCHMFLDCCAEQRTYEKFYGLLAQRFCNINRIYIGPFEDIFKDSYSTAHRLDTNRLRNVSKFFAHLLFTDSISWEALECVKLNEEDTTSSSRIYIKILFQELAEYMGLKKLNDRLKDQTLQGAFSGIFPRDNPKNTRFSINFFTSIGLGGLTDELREHLKQMPKNVPAPVQEINLDSESESSSSSSSSSSDESSSSPDGSDGENKKKKKSKKDKTKDKGPKTPEQTEADKNKNNERWGHDGFYDTYGKDARRTENQKRDKDNFVMPQDVFHRDGRNKNAQRDEGRDNDDRRRRDDRNGRDSRDDSRDRNRDDRNFTRQNQDENRRNYYQSTNRDDDYNRTRHENEKSDNGGRYTDQRREDRYQRNSDREESRNRRQDYREAEEKSREDSNRDDRRLERRRNSAEEREKLKDNRGDRRKDQRKSDNEEERSKDKSNREDRRSDKKRDNAEEEERLKDRRKGRSDEVDRSKEKSNREDKGRESRKYNVEENLSKSKLSKQDKEMEKRNYDEGEERSRYWSDKEGGREKKRNNYDEEGRTSNKKNIQKDDSFDSKRKDKNKNERKANTSDLSSSKNKNKQDSSEDEDSRSKNQNKTEKHDGKKKKPINIEASSSEDSDGEDERHRKRKDKKSKRKKKGKENARDDDGWDIRTGASIRRELGERYWEK